MRCLSPQQKKDCGMELNAPPLIMPLERDKLDEDIDLI
jgi:hypothetical protein